MEILARFNAIFVDEAAACTLPSALIPIVAASKNHGSGNSLIFALVGDPYQLCPVLKSTHHTAKQVLEQYLLQKLLQKRDYLLKKVFLSIQYRMHPALSRIVSEVFYNGHLRNGPCVYENGNSFFCSL